MVAEIAAAVMLLVGAGLLARTFAELRRVDIGFETSNRLVLRITPDAARYRTPAQTTDYYRRVLESLREVPAIASVAAVTALPMSAIGSDFTRPYWPEHAPPSRHGGVERQHPDGDTGLLRNAGSCRDRRTRVHRPRRR